MRLQQNFIPKTKNQNKKNLNKLEISKEEKELIQKEVEIINDNDLKKSIVNLGASIKREDNQ